MKFKSGQSNAFLEVLKISGFRNLWFGQILSQTAANSLLFVLSISLYQATNSNTAVSLIFIVYGIPALIFGLAAGTITDKINRKHSLFFCDISRAILTLSLFLFPVHIFIIYILMFINSIITQFYVPSEGPTIPELVPANKLMTANSLFSFTYYTSLAMGSILAGPLIKIFGNKGVYIFLAGLFGLASFFIYHIKMPTHTKIISLNREIYTILYVIKRFIANYREVVRILKSSRQTIDALIILISTQIVMAILGTLGPGFADRVLGIDLRDASILITGPAIFGIIIGAVSVGAASEKIKPDRLISFGLVAGGVILFAVSIISAPFWMYYISPDMHVILRVITIVLFFILGLANGIIDVPANSKLQQSTPENLRGRIYGILAASVGGIGILPVIAGGIMADTIGINNVFLLLSIVLVFYGYIRFSKNMISS